jgi:hypothetical protein
MVNSNNMATTGVEASKPKFILQYHNNATQIQHILPNDRHFLQKQVELSKAIVASRFHIEEIYISMDTITHTNTTTRYISKIQFKGSGIPTFSSTKESDRYLDIVIANLNDAIQFIRDTKERLKDKPRDK